MFVLIHGSRSTRNYIRAVKVDCTGIDITYCDKERTALQFVSKSAAIHVSRALVNYGNFYPKEIGGKNE